MSILLFRLKRICAQTSIKGKNFTFTRPNWDRKLQFSGISTQTLNLDLGNLKLTKAAAFDINYFLK